MKIIAIETATEACSSALWVDGEVTAHHRVAPRLHAELLLDDVQSLLSDAGLELGSLDGIAFGRGPGSFTGVRIAAAMTQGLALAAGLPVAPVSTLAALAQGAVRESGAGRVIAALDARRSEVYVGRFTAGPSGLVGPDGAESVLAPRAVTPPGEGGWHGVGQGFNAQRGALRERLAGVLGALEAERLPEARDVAALGADILARGEGVPAERALPVYLRDKVAEKPKG